MIKLNTLIMDDDMAIPRKDQIDSENGGYYHLICRCVRRAFLCGQDPDTKIDYEHRRQWIENRILELANVFSIEVYAYAIMHNHYHLVVYSDPLAPNQWSDLEVADRWLKAFPGRLDKPGFKQQRELRLQAIMADKKLLTLYRERLGNLSWLMRRINEPLAKQANQQDACKGHFWESRFTSQALLDDAAALACMAYVDLNPIRAGVSKTLEQSEHTSIKKRVEKFTASELNQTIQSIEGHVKQRTMVIDLKAYIALVEWTGKTIAYPGKQTMPAHIQSVLKQLNINHSEWTSQIKYYGSNYARFVGSVEAVKLKIEQLGQQWIKGSKNLKQLFVTQT